MYENFWLGVFVLVVVIFSLMRRALRGPQKRFSRLAIALALASITAALGAERQGDFFSLMASILMLFSMLSALAMAIIQMKWVVASVLDSDNKDK